MAKRKRDAVVPEMRERLLANRDGRLHVGQWIDLIVQPLLVLALLTGAGFLVFGTRMLILFERAWWVLLPAVLLLVLFPVTVRAYRYARAPIHFARLYAGVQTLGGWRSQVFYTAGDEQVVFPRRLAPRLPLKIEREYLVYFLDEPNGKVLLSIAPADHEDADLWQPTKTFDVRYTRRTGSR